MNFENLKKTDSVCYNFVLEEIERQETTLELIPSECIASLSTIEALWSPFTNKYSEWYSKKRYYWWNEIVDKVELLAIERAKQVFWVEHANVQPYSWSPANLAVYNAVCEVWDTTMWLSLTEWWHLTHWWNVSATSKYFNPVLYWLKDDWYIDLEEVERLALEQKPKLIWVWATAYPREFPFKEFARIADKVWAYLAADIAHISWLIISWDHISPVPYAHIVTTTTHKTLRWPRWGMIMLTKKWLEKDPLLAKKIDKSVFPWLQGWPHDHQTLAICVALWEALKPEFKEIWHKIVKNSKVLASGLKSYWFELATWWTDNHLILMSVWKWRWWFMQEALDIAWITLNKNTIPNEPGSAFNPSWVRMWTPIMTMRWMRENEMKQVAKWIYEVSEEIKDFVYLKDKEERKKQKKDFSGFIEKNKRLKEIKQEIKELCLNFPIYNR